MEPLNKNDKTGEGIGACLVIIVGILGMCWILSLVIDWLFTHVKII